MVEIDFFNYSLEEIKDRTYDVPVELVFKKESYGIDKTNKRIDIHFENVVFKNGLSIKKNDKYQIFFSINFSYCFIESFSSLGISNDNYGIILYSSLCHNFISRNERELFLNNSFGIFNVSNAKNVSVTYNESDIFPRKWSKSDELKKVLSYKTQFTFSNIEKVSMFGYEKTYYTEQESRLSRSIFYIEDDYFLRKIGKNGLKRILTKEEKLKFNINVNLIYNNSSDLNHNNTKIESLPINSLSIAGKPNGDFTIKDCSLRNIFLKNFSPQNSFSLINIRGDKFRTDSRFEIRDSILDNTFFNSVRLDDFSIVFHRSSFINTKFYSTVFPSVKNLLDSNKFSYSGNNYRLDKKKKKESFNRNMYELFLELKQSLEKRGNLFEAQKMKAVSHDYLFKIGNRNLFKSSFWDNTFVLLLNRLSNFHGISIRNALLSTIILVTIFHGLNILSYKSYAFGWNGIEEFYEIFNYTKRYLFVIANPTHKISSLAPKNEFTGYTYLISFVSRVLIGYIYYQFVSSFRRFGK